MGLGFSVAWGVTSEEQKFSYVSQALDPRVAVEVREIIVNTPAENAYKTLKTQLVKRLNTFQEQKTRRLLEMEEMGDRKPSQFLRHLQTLAGTTVSDSMLRTLWFSRLPSSMQTMLAAQQDLSLERLADLADSILDLTGNRATVAAIANIDVASQIQQILSPLHEELANLWPS
ncbi:hypothetical protein NQ315_017510 [Exocentrus adspersus]|uniref:DUF7041 domain-containing protein n=1 Tax=Exocentrus adspersus TaxID=1586481 RepID=A0AAV8VJ92_9CUCU|nr:hypothetical protein NQ315_017510 [Exocentrus adspersus]